MASLNQDSQPMTTVKILTIGSANGSIRGLFSKIRTINAKHGKFDFVLCLGDFFGPLQERNAGSGSQDQTEELLNGTIEGMIRAHSTPLTCYIMQGLNPLPGPVIEKYAQTGGQLCKDVFLINKSGVVSTAQGLKIACLGGIYNADIYDASDGPPGFASPFYTTHTVERLLSNTMNKSLNAKEGYNYSSLATIRDAAYTSPLIDILITNDWPSSITAHSSMSPLLSPGHGHLGSPPLDGIVRKIKPRYHFAARAVPSPRFWEREPFSWDDEPGRISRFISLGAFGEEGHSGQKERWFYAFSIVPSTSGKQMPSNITKNPFVDIALCKRDHETFEGENFIFGNVQRPIKRQRGTPTRQTDKPPVGYKCKRCQSTEHFIDNCPERTKPPDGYLCKICGIPGHLIRDCPTKHAVGDTGGSKPREGYVCRACGSELHYIADCPVANQHGSQAQGGNRKPPKEIGPEECWFCLSNPNLAKHLIVSIGTECYLTLPKGQIIPTQPAPDKIISRIPGGGHVLIVPICHQPTYNTISSDILLPILDETERYKVALRSMFATYGAVPVFYEVARLNAKGGHAHVQVVPVPSSLQNQVEAAFVEEGRTQGIDFESDADGALRVCAGGTRSYFRVDLPDGRKLVHLMKDHVPFSVQFGRQVLASLLNTPHRLDWKTCLLSEQEDKADVELFRKAFATFDPSL